MRALRSSPKWGVKQSSRNKLNGYHESFDYTNGLPVLFRTRRQARDYIKREFGYIAARKDLRREPYGWHMPVPVRVQVVEIKP